MKTEFMVAITQLSAEKNLSKEVVLSAVESALVSAYKKDFFAPTQEISVNISVNTGAVKVYVKKRVIDEVADPLTEIPLDEAQKIERNAQIDDIVSIECTPPNAGRIAAQTARQVILQRLHEAEHHAIYEEFICREGDIVTGIIQRIIPDMIYVDLGKAEGILPPNEQVHNERYRVGRRLKFYLMEVARTSRGPQIIVSRSHRNLLRRLFELEIPEIVSGIVELKSVAREAGYRSKVAVAARQTGIDPVGCCVGLRGIRIQNIINELNGEKIDVVQWVSDPALFIANALSPSQVSSVELNTEESTAVVVVPDKQLSLAIGKEGQNARLAAKLTGWRIDIKSASAVEAEKASVAVETPAEVEPVETDVESVIAEIGEPVPEVVPAEENLTPELVALPDLSEIDIGEEPIEEEVEEAVEEASEVIEIPTDVELVLSSGIQATAGTDTAPQIRFAEDILPHRAKAKKKESAKKDADQKDGGPKKKKARPKREIVLEEDDFEG